MQPWTEALQRLSSGSVHTGCQLGISRIFKTIQVVNTSKLLPENPTNHQDSRNSKKIQEAQKSVVFLGIIM